MADDGYNLAIETSGRVGSLALGCGDELLETVSLPTAKRHNVDLVPVLAEVFHRRGLKPDQLEEVYVSIGPGSFTGLRIAISTVKMLALAGGIRIVAVPTLDVVVRNTPDTFNNAAVCLNLKRGTVWSGIYVRDGSGVMVIRGEAALRTMADLLDQSPRPIAVIGAPLPAMPELPASELESVTILPAEQAAARCESAWQSGRERRKRGEFTSPESLQPLYARRPEAVELWDQRKRKNTTQSIVK